MTDHDQPDEELLRRVLHDEAETIPIDDGLGEIRRRTAGVRPGGSRWLIPLTAAAGVLLVVGAIAVGIAVADRDSATPPAGGPSASGTAEPAVTPSPSAAPSDTASPTATPTATPRPTATPEPPIELAAVYYVSEVPGFGPRLYREYHLVPDAGGAAAVTDMLTTAPEDPDYGTLWPEGTQLLDYAVDGDVATVDVSAFPAVGAEYESQAVQQLVWTVTGADESVTAVRLRVNGEVPLSGHDDWTDPVPRGTSYEVLSQVWITEPIDGEPLPGDFDVTVYGTGFEGVMVVTAYRTDDGTEAGHVQLQGEMGVYREVSQPMTLPAGTYELRATAPGGENVEPVVWDSKRISVEPPH